MKRYVKASSSSTILTSQNGNFELVQRSGVGRNKTPWTSYEVKSKGLAEKHVVEIRIQNKDANYNGEPVELEPYYVYIAHGMRSTIDTGSDIKELISVLEEALDFKADVNTYFATNIPGYKARD